MATVRNNRSGETITTDFDHAEAARRFAEAHAGDSDHWLWFWIHRYAQNARQQGPAAVPGRATSALTFLGDLFVVATGQGLKRPMIRAHYKDQRFKFYLSARGTVCLKSGGLALDADGKPTHDPIGDEQYIGCLLNGDFLPARNAGVVRTMTATEREFLDKFCESPVSFLAECSKDMNRCCYCNKALEDARSMRIGYGKICAAHWGLPWGDDEYMQKAPSFAKAYTAEASAIIAGIREKPQDEAGWLAFADWLEERGLPRCSKPTERVVVARK